MGYDNLKLEKGMYRQEGMNFTQVLESLDPSENYRGTALEGTDAFQRQLKRFGIRPEECAAFGDYMNDAEMMEAVSYSFAMGNAYPAIKKLARFETGTNVEKGVLMGIERLMKEGLI